MDKRTQCNDVLEFLQNGGEISSADAMSMFGIGRLASRICDLRQSGHSIRGHTVTATNRYGRPTHYTVYSLGDG